MTDREATIDAPDALPRQLEDQPSRRALFTAVLGTAAAGVGAFAISGSANAQTVTEADLLNFLLNLEYLQANYFAFAVSGAAIATGSTSGTGTVGTATGGRKITFTDAIVGQYAREIAAEDLTHVTVLRATIGSTAVAAQPAIDLGTGASSAFGSFAQAAGLVAAGSGFDPYASDENFLLGAFLLKDVSVTAYKGVMPLLTTFNSRRLVAAMLGTEAYHSATIRSALYRKGILTQTGAISDARDVYNGGTDLDQGIAPVDTAQGPASNVVPADGDGIVFGRSTGQVLNIAFLNRGAVASGGFFPSGLNGTIKTSAAN
jgi:Ferritin-like domain